MTYAVVDKTVERELGLGFDGRGVIVVLTHHVFPLAHKGSGQNATTARVMHGELEVLLRGRSLDEYLMANRFVRERGLSDSSEDAQFVLEHLGVESRALADGFL